MVLRDIMIFTRLDDVKFDVYVNGHLHIGLNSFHLYLLPVCITDVHGICLDEWQLREDSKPHLLHTEQFKNSC